MKNIPLTPVKTTHHERVVPKVILNFYLVYSTPPPHFKEKKGGVFKTILLFVRFMAEGALPWRGKVSYACIETLLYIRGKYVSKGLITCVCRLASNRWFSATYSPVVEY